MGGERAKTLAGCRPAAPQPAAATPSREPHSTRGTCRTHVLSNPTENWQRYDCCQQVWSCPLVPPYVPCVPSKVRAAPAALALPTGFGARSLSFSPLTFIRTAPATTGRRSRSARRLDRVGSSPPCRGLRVWAVESGRMRRCAGADSRTHCGRRSESPVPRGSGWGRTVTLAPADRGTPR